MKMFRFLAIAAVLMNMFLSNAVTQDQFGLPKGAKSRIGNGTALTIAFSPDGTQFAVGTTIGIWIYDVPTYKIRSFLTSHAGYVTAIEYSPDGQILASGNSDATIRLWNPKTGRNFAVLRGHEGSINKIAFLPDGETLVSNSSQDKKIYFWNLKIDLTKEHEAIVPEKSYPGSAYSMALSPDGETLAIGKDNPNIILWNLKLGRTKTFLRGHTWVPSDTQYAKSGVIYSLAFSPDGETLASSSSDTTIRLWDTKTAKHKVTLTRNGRSAPTLLFSPDGKTLANTATGFWRTPPMIRLRDAATGKLKTTIDFPAGTSSVYTLAFASDSETLASIDRDSTHNYTIRIWDLKTGKLEKSLSEYKDMRFFARVSRHGRMVSHKNQDGTIQLTDVTAGTHRTILKDCPFRISSPNFPYRNAFHRYSRDWKTLAIGDENAIQLWDIETDQYKTTLVGHTERLSLIVFSPDANTLIGRSHGRNGTIHLWNTKTGEKKATLQSDLRSAQYIAFSQDGKTFAAPAPESGMIQLYHTDTGHPKLLLIGQKHGGNSILFSPDGNSIVSDRYGDTVLWDARTGNLIVHIDRPENHNFSFMFSPNGKILVGYAKPYSHEKADGAIWVWDAKTGQYKTKLEGHKGRVTHTLFADSKTLVSAGSDATIRIWNIETEQLKNTLLEYNPYSPIVFAPDGVTLVWGSLYNTIRFWDIEIGEQIASFKGYGPVESIVFAPDLRTFITQGIDGTILLWDAPQLFSQ